ncbi:TPA: hypothetical protein DIV55_00225 [Patescibacteria group bacterium]|uniref:Glycosyltransferase RgtA/B/C/D-like domain-containing protein n=1 Tax=Candidatus Gottesmanbacteria bacterium GW2011_GWA1_43_11 TaxID=1618436 RepID=A0A0G1CJ75_9BACT|nr:MAG: hypothetical protein UV59_C0004G0023 [Candidatus Gottesmanbacteria bacterium GW2011_GWA1_43_11]HCS78152.1 hypothetical protein [Patescibacteria group bacterium]
MKLTKLWLPLLVAVYFVVLLWPIRSFYTRPFDYVSLGETYASSQYTTGSGSKGIGDDGLYAFAGYYYITGGDPSQVNFENPPFGKYLIGLSVLVFGNENSIYVIYAALVLWGTYLLAKSVFKSKSLAVLAVSLLGLLHLFIIQFVPTSPTQYSITLLDLPLTMFFLWGVWFFLRTPASWCSYLISSLLFGLAFITKFFPALLILLPVLLGYQFFYRRKDLIKYGITLLLVPFIYLVSYLVYFYYHASLVEFIEFQKYIISWRLGNPIVMGNIFRTIFTGSYQNWWDGGLTIDHEWTRELPVLFILALIGGMYAIKTNNHKLQLLLALSLVFITYLTVGSVGVARYLLVVTPFLTILSANGVSKIVSLVFAILVSRGYTKPVFKHTGN